MQRADAQAASLGEPPCVLRVRQHLVDRAREMVGVLGAKERTRVADHLAHGRDVGSQDRRPDRPGFEEDDPEGLVPGRLHEEVGGGEQRALGALGEHRQVPDALRAGCLAEHALEPFRRWARQRQDGRRQVPHGGEGAQQDVEALGRRLPPQVADQGRAGRDRERRADGVSRRARRCERCRVDRIGRAHDAVAPHAAGPQHLRLRSGDCDDAIAVPENPLDGTLLVPTLVHVPPTLRWKSIRR